MLRTANIRRNTGRIQIIRRGNRVKISEDKSDMTPPDGKPEGNGGTEEGNPPEKPE
jgi:hypothetical protein